MSRPVHQDYIVRQRFSNALPPPPGAPKLLDIPYGGLEQYCSPAYASRLARAQPLNIEADAELGMPIDYVGIPGVFDGDESSIMAPLKPPPVHPRDRNLLRPLKAIGQSKKETGISFLRRTQYTADGVTRAAVAMPGLTGTAKRRRLDNSKEDPKAILRNMIKGFDLANPEDVYTGPDGPDSVRGMQPTQAEVDAWRNPKHPTNPSLKPVDFYPVIPDLDALPTDAGYMVARFHGNPAEVPVAGASGAAEKRDNPLIQAAFLRAVEPAAEVMADYQEKVATYERDPANSVHPGMPPINFEMFLPESASVAETANTAFDVDATPANQLEALYTTTTDDSQPHFRYKHARIYEPRQANDHQAFPYEWVALALHDGPADNDLDELGLGDDDDDEDAAKKKRTYQKAAYYVPVASTQQLRPKRAIADKFGRSDQRDEDTIDLIQLRARDEEGEEVERRNVKRELLDVRE